MAEKPANPFVAHMKNFTDKFNAHARAELQHLEELGGKRIVIVDMDHSCWEGILIGYNYMYIDIDRNGESMRMPMDNVERIIVPEDADAVEPK